MPNLESGQKGNIQGGEFDPVLWIEFGVAQWSERLVRRTKDPDKNCLKANTAMISSPHRAEPRRSPTLRYMATPTLFPPHSSIFRERYRAARRFHCGRSLRGSTKGENSIRYCGLSIDVAQWLEHPVHRTGRPGSMTSSLGLIPSRDILALNAWRYRQYAKLLRLAEWRSQEKPSTRSCYLLAWPPNSPDLTSADFFVWGFVKDIVYSQKPRNIDDLRVKITQAFQQITSLMLRRTWAELHHRYELWRVRKGDHVEL
ncbi:hypothetical protein ANN_26945 [Periplaneta americana]|uniref:Uncharacterized protein n=1 Tax=Periplaneta americana TaxID=6978 RepID=A0ABQ8RWS5_PERAM|nr:hypothetical protein ANN_26945 [Periplaneta americana]